MNGTLELYGRDNNIFGIKFYSKSFTTPNHILLLDIHSFSPNILPLASIFKVYNIKLDFLETNIINSFRIGDHTITNVRV